MKMLIERCFFLLFVFYLQYKTFWFFFEQLWLETKKQGLKISVFYCFIVVSSVELR